MIVQIFNMDIVKILTVFSLSPGSKFSRNELQEKTKLINVNLDNALSILFNSTMIIKDKRMISFNNNFANVLQLISGEHRYMKNIPLDAYFPVLELSTFIAKYKLEAYLFGSYSKLIYKNDSDIDIAIISDALSSMKKKKISRQAQKLSDKYNKEIELQFFSTEFNKNKKDPIVADILRNGIKLI
jgi:predicted nucleotidyltransferase